MMYFTFGKWAGILSSITFNAGSLDFYELSFISADSEDDPWVRNSETGRWAPKKGKCVCGGNGKGGNMEGGTNMREGGGRGNGSSDASIQNKGPLMRRHLSYGLPDNNSVKNYILFSFSFYSWIHTHMRRKRTFYFINIDSFQWHWRNSCLGAVYYCLTVGHSKNAYF